MADKPIQNWTDTWMRMAHVIAAKSKDPSFSAGAVVVRADNKSLLSVGFNGPPPQIRDDFDRTDRDLKHALTIHAEDNALWFAVAAHKQEALMGGYLYVNGKPCSGCARAIARSGVGTVVWDDTNPAQPRMVDEKEWGKTILILYKADVELIPYSQLKGK